jgi:putative heme transporter
VIRAYLVAVHPCAMPRTRADAQRPRLGDRVEAALEQRADLAGELERGAVEQEQRATGRSGALRRMAFWLAVSAVSLYLVAPAVLDVLGSWRQIAELPPEWLAAMAVLEAAALACIWWLQRIAIHGTAWRAVIASQLAGNSLAKIAPGGGAMGAALQYRMLVAAGTPPGQTAAGLTAAGLLTMAVVLALPVLALPAILRGGVEPDLLDATLIGLAVFVALFAAGALCVASDRPLLWIGRTVQRARNRLRRRSRPLERLPQRLVAERDRILATVGRRWRPALVAGLGRWAFDFGCLLAALQALDALPRPGLVLLAFCAAQLLAQVPVTPGGLGFVEAGLTATLALAGVAPADALTATFAYRLFAYWLQLPLGLVGVALGRAGAAEISEPVGPVGNGRV